MSSQSGKSPTGPRSHRRSLGPRALVQSQGLAPGPSLAPACGHWPSCQGITLLQTSQSQTFLLFSGSPCSLFLLSPSGSWYWALPSAGLTLGWLSNSGFFSKAEASVGLKGLCCRLLLLGLLGPPRLSLRVVCLPGKYHVYDPCGDRAGGRRKVDTKLGDPLRYFCSVPPTHSLLDFHTK